MGGVAVACCALMAWYGAGTLRVDASPLFLFAYWGIFLGLLVVVFFTVLLDIRFIRLQYRLGEREIFHSTLGSEDFRRALGQAQQQRKEAGDETPEG